MNLNLLFSQKPKRKYLWYWLIAIIAVAGIAVLVLAGTTKLQEIISYIKGEPKTLQYPKLQGTITEVPFENLPDKFPTDIPLEEGAKVVKNYNSNYTNGWFEATRVFETARSPEENYTFYKNYFSDNGWIILPSTNDNKLEGIKFIAATQNKVGVEVLIREYPGTGIKIVGISITHLP